MTTFAAVTDPRFLLVVANYYKKTATRKDLIATYKRICGNEANIDQDFLEYLYQQTEHASTSMMSSASMIHGIYDADAAYSELWGGNADELPEMSATYEYLSLVIDNAINFIKSI